MRDLDNFLAQIDAELDRPELPPLQLVCPPRPPEPPLSRDEILRNNSKPAFALQPATGDPVLRGQEEPRPPQHTNHPCAVAPVMGTEQTTPRSSGRWRWWPW